MENATPIKSAQGGSQKKILLITGVIAGVFLLIFLVTSFLANRKTIAQNTLVLSSPILSFAGKVDKVEKGALHISQTIEGKTVSYKVFVDETTPITRDTSSIPYLFKKQKEQPPVEKVSIHSIKGGDVILVTSESDLRLLKKSEFKAHDIRIPAKINLIIGSVTAVEGNKIKVLGVFPAPAIAELKTTPTPQREYTVEITNETEVSSQILSANAPLPISKKLAVSDLQIGSSVNIFTNESITSQDVTAALVRVVAEPITPETNPTGTSQKPVQEPSPIPSNEQ